MTADGCLIMQNAHNITELVGRTRLVRLNKIPQAFEAVPQILVKVESINLATCLKDRIGANMVEAVEKAGLIHPRKTI